MNQPCPKMTLCPYDKFHAVREDRLDLHLQKCRKNHMDKGFVICPFNTTHVMAKDEYDAHEKTCMDKRAFEMQRDRFEDADASCEEYKTRPLHKDGIEAVKIFKQRLIVESDFFPMGVMVADDLPPQVMYSRGRARFWPP